MSAISVGSIVRCRNREWIVLPRPDDEVYLLRPLSGTEEEIIGVHHSLHDRHIDPIEPASFPPPDPSQAGDAASIELLFNAARLTLRDGAGPFRSLGRLSVRPRPYQFVPLLMALRLDPVRMLIADDVGIGKTIEALLIARELLDRGEITRTCVLCPPYLCEQWEHELWDKFRIRAVVIRSGTVARLERDLPSSQHSIFGYYPHIVVSIDYAKSDTHRANFLQHAPEFVIADEAHGATDLPAAGRDQQQRHELLRRLAESPHRHLILLTATPHSGIEDAFLSLLGLLRSEFRQWPLARLNDSQRAQLARHFVQRRRADVKHWLGEETPFPNRLSEEQTYSLSPVYNQLFQQTFSFCRDVFRRIDSRSSDPASRFKQRVNYWGILALLRCVMSSPAAAVASLSRRIGPEESQPSPQTLSPQHATSPLTAAPPASPPGEDSPEQLDAENAPYILDAVDENATDAQPSRILHELESQLPDSDRTRYRALRSLAEKLRGSDDDSKLLRCSELVAQLLSEGRHPIIWCRYIDTSDYVAEQLRSRLSRRFPGLLVRSITGALAEDERRQLIDSIDPVKDRPRVLVATDCLSEGINLQRLFDAVLHYDLPWNPNRLDQREGRVDRYGQPSREVKAILFFGRDNPIDTAVLEVLLRKANRIYRTLGVRVPLPIQPESVMDALIDRLFRQDQQLSLFEIDVVRETHNLWDRAVEEERISRTRFAQHAIKPEEVQRELDECDSVLADPSTGRRFFLNAAQRLGLSLKVWGETVELAGFENLPDPLRIAAPRTAPWRVTFGPNPPAGIEPVDRNHPFLQSVAQYLTEKALSGDPDSPARRCGVIRTRSVSLRTWILLCRLRYTIKTPDAPDLLAEEVQCFAFEGSPARPPQWLSEDRAVELLRSATPDANITEQERAETLCEFLPEWDRIRDALDPLVLARARRLEDAHRRVRASVQLARRGTSVARHFPPDLLGVLALLPIPPGVRS